jgi:hypothetical protein
MMSVHNWWNYNVYRIGGIIMSVQNWWNYNECTELVEL